MKSVQHSTAKHSQPVNLKIPMLGLLFLRNHAELLGQKIGLFKFLGFKKCTIFEYKPEILSQV